MTYLADFTLLNAVLFSGFLNSYRRFSATIQSSNVFRRLGVTYAKIFACVTSLNVDKLILELVTHESLEQSLKSFRAPYLREYPSSREPLLVALILPRGFFD